MLRVDEIAEFAAGPLGLGLHCEIKLIRARPDELPAHTAVAALRGVAHDGSVQTALGSGCAADLRSAVAAAVGEGIERWYLKTPPRELPVCSASDLSDARVLSAEEWPTFTPEQLAHPGFPARRYEPEERRPWTRVVGIQGREVLWVPASLVWVSAAASPFMPGVSSGAAYHSTRELAQLSGLMEVVERDAFCIVWESRAVTPLLDPCAAWQQPEVARLCRSFERCGLRFLLRDMTTDLGIPSVLAVVHDPLGRRPALCLGAASRPSMTEACRKAAWEAYHTWTWMRDEHDGSTLEHRAAVEQAANPAQMMAHPFLYGFPEATIGAAHLLAEAEMTAVAEPCGALLSRTQAGDTVAAVVNRLAEHGLAAYERVLLPQGEGKTGVALRVIVPGLVPLSIGVWGRALGHPRIGVVPRHMGWEHQGPLPMPDGPPHPFP